MSAFPVGSAVVGHAANFRFPPLLSALAFKPIQFRGCSESRTVPKAGLNLLFSFGHLRLHRFCHSSVNKDA